MDQPEGVAVEYRDGTIYENLPLEDYGLDAEGNHLWRVMLPRDMYEELPVGMTVAHWPAHTGLMIPALAPRRFDPSATDGVDGLPTGEG